MDSTLVRIYDDVKEAINSIASGIGIASEQVWNILVKQQTVIWISWFIEFIVFIVLLWLLKLCIKNIKFAPASSSNITEPGSEFKFTMAWIFGIGSIGMFFILVTTFPDALTAIINPEYGALKQILYIIKEGT